MEYWTGVLIVIRVLDYNFFGNLLQNGAMYCKRVQYIAIFFALDIAKELQSFEIYCNLLKYIRGTILYKFCCTYVYAGLALHALIVGRFLKCTFHYLFLCSSTFTGASVQDFSL